MTTRDSQRQRVYDAERDSGLQRMKGDGTLTIPECQALIDKALASDYLLGKFPKVARLRRDGIKVVATHGGGRARYDAWNGAEIALGVWARQEVIVWHELAHHLVGFSKRHGWEFCAAELILVRRYMGADAHDALEASFKAGRVRYRKPRAKRTMTPEQREAAIARLEAARRSPGEPRPTWHPADTFDRYVCDTCGRDRVATKFPTTRTPGERETRCRDCRDAR